MVPKYLMEQELPIHEPVVESSTVTEKLASPEWPIDNVYDESVPPAHTVDSHTMDRFVLFRPIHEVSPISTTPSYYERLKYVLLLLIVSHCCKCGLLIAACANPCMHVQAASVENR